MLLILSFFFSVFAKPLEVQNGDIILQTSQSSQSKAIQIGTHSPYSHVGIIYLENGKPMVFEAIKTVRLTPLDQWISRGEGNKYTLMRPKKSLSADQLQKMKQVGETYAGKPYDIKFAWEDDTLYCSELVWKIYQEGAGIKLSSPRKMKDYDFDDPKILNMMEKRWNGKINWSEKVVAPSDIANSKKLDVIEDTF